MQVGVRTTFISCLDLLVWNYCRNHIKLMYTVQWNPWEKMTRWPQFWSIYNKQVRQGEQGLRSGENTCLPPVWLGFKSRCWRHVGWVCCWFSSLLREVFLWFLQFSPLHKNQHFQIPIWSGTNGHIINEFIRTPKCFVGKQITIYDLQ